MAAGSPGDDGPRYLFDKEGWRLNLFGERPSDTNSSATASGSSSANCRRRRSAGKAVT